MRRFESPRDLPVDPERLRQQFPDLDDDDLRAYVTVTRRVLGEERARARALREFMDRAREAVEKKAGGATLTADEELGIRYLKAVEKMQRSTVQRD